MLHFQHSPKSTTPNAQNGKPNDQIAADRRNAKRPNEEAKRRRGENIFARLETDGRRGRAAGRRGGVPLKRRLNAALDERKTPIVADRRAFCYKKS